MTVKKKDIVKVGILSMTEYQAIMDIVPKATGWWWLRNTGINMGCAAYVFADGEIYSEGYYVSKAAGVRPYLVIDNDKFKLEAGDDIEVGEYVATYIGEGRVLLDDYICKRPFDPKTNVWEKSELRTFVESKEIINMLFEKAE